MGSDLTAYRTWLAAPATLGLSLRTLSTHAVVNLTICPTVWPFAFGLDGADWDMRMEHDGRMVVRCFGKKLADRSPNEYLTLKLCR